MFIFSSIRRTYRTLQLLMQHLNDTMETIKPKINQIVQHTTQKLTHRLRKTIVNHLRK